MNDTVIEQRFSELFTLVRDLDKRTALQNSELTHLTKAVVDLKEDFNYHDEAEMKKFERVDDAIKRFEKILWVGLGVVITVQLLIQTGMFSKMAG